MDVCAKVLILHSSELWVINTYNTRCHNLFLIKAQIPMVNALEEIVTCLVQMSAIEREAIDRKTSVIQQVRKNKPRCTRNIRAHTRQISANTAHKSCAGVLRIVEVSLSSAQRFRGEAQVAGSVRKAQLCRRTIESYLHDWRVFL